MKRHYTNYFKGITDFKPYRIKMVTSDSTKEIEDTLDEVIIKFKRVSILRLYKSICQNFRGIIRCY